MRVRLAACRDVSGPALTDDRLAAVATALAAESAQLDVPAEWYGQHPYYVMPPLPPHQFWCDHRLSGRPAHEAAKLAELQRAIDTPGAMIEVVDLIDYLRLRGLADLYFFAKFLMGFTLLEPFHAALAWAWQAPDGWQTPWGQTYGQVRTGVVPRSHYKTTLCTQGDAAWQAIRDPEQRILIYTHSLDFTLGVMGVIKDLFEGVGQGADIFAACYGDRIPSEAERRRMKWDQLNLTLKRRGRYTDPTIFGGAFGAKATGRHFTRQNIDDLVAEDMPKSQMEKRIKALDLLDPLFVSLARGIRRMVATPWAFYDPITYATKHWKGSLVARVPYDLPNGAPIISTSDTAKVLALKKRNPWVYWCQYKCWPKDEEKQGFRRSWFRYFRTRRTSGADLELVPLAADGKELKPVLLSECNVFVSIDPNTGREPGERAHDATAPKKAHDYAGFVVLAIDRDRNRYVLRAIRWRCDPNELVEKGAELVHRWGARLLGLETIAAQHVFLHNFREAFKRGMKPFRIEPWKGGAGSKEERIKGLIPLYANGMVLHREAEQSEVAAGIDALEGELEDFPHAEYDDISDALSATLQFGWAPGESTAAAAERARADLAFDAEMSRLDAGSRRMARIMRRKPLRWTVGGVPEDWWDEGGANEARVDGDRAAVVRGH